MEDNIKSYYQKSSVVNSSQILENINDYQEYFLFDNNIINKFIIGKNEKEVFINCRNYIISFNQNELSSLIKIPINSLDKAFEYTMKIFEDNKVKIANKIKNKEIKIIMEINSVKNIELILIYDKYNTIKIRIIKIMIQLLMK